MTARALLLLVLLGSALAAQEQVIVRRLSDSAAVRDGRTQTERVLYYFDPTAMLVQGDEIEQGSSGHTELLLNGLGHVAMYSTAHVKLVSLSPAGDVLSFFTLTRAYLTAGDRKLTCIFPGGTRCTLQQTEMEVLVHPGRIVVRNEGSGPIFVSGLIDHARSDDEASDGRGKLILRQGEEIELPRFRALPNPAGEVREMWDRLVLSHGGGFALTPGEGELVVEPADASEGVANDVLVVGGVRTFVSRGQRLRIANRRRPVPEPLVLDAETPELSVLTREVYLQAVLQFGQTTEEIRAAGYTVLPEWEEEADRLLEELAAQQAELDAATESAPDEEGDDDSTTDDPGPESDAGDTDSEQEPEGNGS